MSAPRPKRKRLRKAAAQKAPRLTDEQVEALQAATGYVFKDRKLLDTAMTHPSALAGQERKRSSNQRLEFLGDRVLGLVIAERLYDRRPTEQEGGLAPRLNRLVSKSACADAARRMDLGAHVMLGVSERNNGGTDKESILGDLCEAIIAAIYMDGGLKPARAFIERAWAEQFASTATRIKDTKSLLQEWAQARGHSVPEYKVLKRSGPDHAPRFDVRVRIGSGEEEIGKGASKQDAERAAATALLTRLEAGASE